MNAAQMTALLLSNDRAVTKAMIVLLSYQTSDERVNGHTVESNGLGFNVADADLATYCACWAMGLKRGTKESDASWNQRLTRILDHYLTGDNFKGCRTLSGSYLVKCRAMAIKYRRQLVYATNARQAA